MKGRKEGRNGAAVVWCLVAAVSDARETNKKTRHPTAHLLYQPAVLIFEFLGGEAGRVYSHFYAAAGFV